MHISFTRPGRTGRAALHALGAIVDGKWHGWSDDLEFHLNFVFVILNEDHTRYYPFTKVLRETPRIWTDASFSIKEEGPVTDMCGIVANGSTPQGVVWRLPQSWYPLHEPRATQIVIGQLLAVVFSRFLLWAVPSRSRRHRCH